MEPKEAVIGGWKCLLYGENTAQNIIFWFSGEHERSIRDSVYRRLKREMTSVSFMLVVCEVHDWNAQLSPWYAPALYGKDAFIGEGSRTLEWLERECLPYLEQVLQSSLAEKTLLIGGYSLSGLFALWAFYELGIFTGVAACSASLWFPGWLEYTRIHRLPDNSVIYLSLGTKEEKAGNQVMASVGDATRTQYEQYLGDAAVREVTLEWNPGNHFHEPDVRLLKGFRWLLDKV